MAHCIWCLPQLNMIDLLPGSVLAVASCVFITLSYAHTLVGQAIKLGITAPAQLFKIPSYGKKCLSKTEKRWHRDKLKQGSVKYTESLTKYCERERGLTEKLKQTTCCIRYIWKRTGQRLESNNNSVIRERKKIKSSRLWNVTVPSYSEEIYRCYSR